MSPDVARPTYQRQRGEAMSDTQGASGCNADWGLYRHFLAVADTGSLTAAARQLGVSQPTVGRQIQALEKAMGSRLFDRNHSGYVLTATGEAIVAQARTIQEQAIAIERCAAGKDRRLEGRVCISAAEGLATYWLAPKLPALRSSHPAIDIELIVGTAALDLLFREADIVLRIGEPRAEDLIGRRLCRVHFGLFAAEAYLAAHGPLESPCQLPNHVIIESVGAIADLTQARRLREMAVAAPVALRCDNLVTQLAALRAGMGVMALPLYMAQAVPDLRRVMADEFDVALDLWLLVHRDLRPVARIDAVFGFLADAICRDKERFAASPEAGLSHP